MKRRTLLKLAGGAGLAMAGTAQVACRKPAPSQGTASKTIKLGYVSPQTGPLAAFGEPDNFVIGKVREALKGGLTIGGQSYAVEIIVKDSQSNPNRAAQVTKDLIVQDKVDLMLAA